jgi:hypothetical protein
MQHLWRIYAGELNEARAKKGIVALPWIDFIEPNKYIFPQLHFEIGTVNNVFDALRGFIEDEVEVLSDAEKEARNAKITTDVRYTKAKDKAEAFNSTGGAIELKLFRTERCCLNQALKDKNLAEDRRNSLLEQWQVIDDEIESLSMEQKRLKADASAKRISFMEAAKAMKEQTAKKTKLDKPTTATMESILLN